MTLPADTLSIPTAAPRGARTGPPVITPTFLLAWALNFVQFLVFYVLITTMAVYAITEFQASDAAAGFASSAFVAGATVIRIFSGHLVDALGPRRVMIVSLIVAVAATALYIPAHSLGLLIAVRLVHGGTFAIASTATMAIAQSVVPAERRAEGTGYLALTSTLATAVGPALGLFLVAQADYPTLFLVSLGITVVGLVLGLIVRPAPIPVPAERERFSFRRVVHPAVMPVGIFMLFVGLCYSGVVTYLNAYSVERDVVAGAGMFFVAYAISMLVMRFVMGRVQDRRGDNTVIYPALVAFLAALVLLAVADADWQIVVAGVLTGLGYGSIMPAVQSIAVRSVPPHRIGTGISTLLLFTDFGVGMGPVALGFVVSGLGYGWMYLGLAGMLVLAVLWYALTHGRRAGGRPVPGRHGAPAAR